MLIVAQSSPALSISKGGIHANNGMYSYRGVAFLSMQPIYDTAVDAKIYGCITHEILSESSL